MFWRRFAVSKIPMDDPKAFEIWLRNRWIEKDRLIEYYYLTGKFPADAGVDKAPNGKTRRGAGYIETEIKAFHWYEFLQVFAPIGLFALVLYVFYGALPKRFVKSLNRKAIVDKAGAVVNTRIKGSGKKLLMDAAPKVSGKELAVLQNVVTTPKAVIQKEVGQKALQVKVPIPSVIQKLVPTQTSVAKVPQKQTSSSAQRPATKPAATPASKQLQAGSALKVAPKNLAVQPKVRTSSDKAGPPKLAPKKPATKPQASTSMKKPAISKPGVKFATPITPKKSGTTATRAPKTVQAPVQKMATKPKTIANVKKTTANQNTT